MLQPRPHTTAATTPRPSKLQSGTHATAAITPKPNRHQPGSHAATAATPKPGRSQPSPRKAANGPHPILHETPPTRSLPLATTTSTTTPPPTTAPITATPHARPRSTPSPWKLCHLYRICSHWGQHAIRITRRSRNAAKHTRPRRPVPRPRGPCAQCRATHRGGGNSQPLRDNGTPR